VLAYHFRDHLGVGLGAASGLVAHGNLGVDLFFLLSGFILAHVYLDGVAAGTHRHAAFLWNRIARVWPLHVATLAGMVMLWIVGSRTGADFDPAAFNPADLPAHLLMVHAWGTTETVGWNFPSWSISAEWAAYLLFPLIAAGVLAVSRRPALALGAVSALMVAAYFGLEALYGRPFTELTAQGGALRILPTFALGVTLYAITCARGLPPAFGWPLVCVSVLWIVAVTQMHLEPLWAWLGLAGLVVGLAEAARRGQAGFAGTPVARYLGEISYAMYMTHLAVDIVWFRLLAMAGVDAAQPEPVRMAAVVGAWLATIAVSVVAYEAIERPARVWLRRLGDRWFARPAAPPAARGRRSDFGATSGLNAAQGPG
jgi:peptidoglycan/LPS O-acetylase OafA/YrhL